MELSRIVRAHTSRGRVIRLSRNEWNCNFTCALCNIRQHRVSRNCVSWNHIFKWFCVMSMPNASSFLFKARGTHSTLFNSKDRLETLTASVDVHRSGEVAFDRDATVWNAVLRFPACRSCIEIQFRCCCRCKVIWSSNGGRRACLLVCEWVNTHRQTS